MARREDLRKAINLRCVLCLLRLGLCSSTRSGRRSQNEPPLFEDLIQFPFPEGESLPGGRTLRSAEEIKDFILLHSGPRRAHFATNKQTNEFRSLKSSLINNQLIDFRPTGAA